MNKSSVVMFSGEPGRVIALVDPSTTATSTFNSPLSLEGWQGFSTFKSILTRCMVSQQGNYQFLNSFGGRIYAYTFGDRIGTIGLSGLAFQQKCEDPGVIGIQKVLEYYNKNRIAKRETPMTVTFAGQALKGMLIGMTADVANPESLIFQFDMQFALIPDNVSDDLSAAKDTDLNNTTRLADFPSASQDFGLPPPDYDPIQAQGDAIRRGT